MVAAIMITVDGRGGNNIMVEVGMGGWQGQEWLDDRVGNGRMAGVVMSGW
jgi:hypothetical protein